MRKIIPIMSFVVLIGLFIYKNWVEDKSFQGETTNTHSPVKIKYAFWLPEDDLSTDEAFSSFNSLNRDVCIDPVKIPRERYNDTLNKMMLSGSPPDVYMVNQEWADSYKNKRWMLKLNDYISKDFTENQPEWLKSKSNLNDYGAAFYCAPNSLVTYRFIYNKTLLELVGLNKNISPKTIDELGNYCKVISSRGFENKKYGFILPIEEDWYSYIKSIELVNHASGVHFFKPENNTYDLNSYKEWFEEILKINTYNNYDSQRFGLKSDTILNQFLQGNIGMMFVSSIEASKLGSADRTKCDWEFAAPPTIDLNLHNKGSLLMVPGPYLAVNSRTSHVKESVQVLQYLFSEDFLLTLTEKKLIIPVYPSIIEHYIQKNKEKQDYFTEFLPGLKDRPEVPTPLHLDIWARIKVYKDIIYNQKDLNEVLKEETRRINDINKSYVSGF
jgi:multiple sugar transport system substrate-binding protein